MEVNITASQGLQQQLSISLSSGDTGSFPGTSCLGPSHPNPASQGAPRVGAGSDPCSVTCQNQINKLRGSCCSAQGSWAPAQSWSCHCADREHLPGVAHLQKAGTQECKGKSSCSSRASQSTAKGRESFKSSTQPADNQDFIFLK